MCYSLYNIQMCYSLINVWCVISLINVEMCYSSIDFQMCCSYHRYRYFVLWCVVHIIDIDTSYCDVILKYSVFPCRISVRWRSVSRTRNDPRTTQAAVLLHCMWAAHSYHGNAFNSRHAQYSFNRNRLNILVHQLHLVSVDSRFLNASCIKGVLAGQCLPYLLLTLWLSTKQDTLRPIFT